MVITNISNKQLSGRFYSILGCLIGVVVVVCLTVVGGGGGGGQIQEVDAKGRPIFYTYARDDRSGSAMKDMLFAHAVAFAKNGTYGGACDRSPIFTDPWQQENLKTRFELISTLGLQDVLPSACPKQKNGKIMTRWDYHGKDTEIFTPQWLEYIRSLAEHSLPSSTSRKDGVVQVALHIRRGDVDPCNIPKRYLPNDYYLRILDAYLPKDKPYRVSIYSESQSHESWEPFVARNYTLYLDTDPNDVYRELVAADVLIMSKSSFSLIPALLTRGQVLYTPFWHKPLASWTVVRPDLVAPVESEIERVRGRCPIPPWTLSTSSLYNV